jgi:hypothetical protein
VIVERELMLADGDTKMARLAKLGRGYAPQQGEVGLMKPKWIRFRKRSKEVDPEGVLQTGLWLFSATCGATLLLAACNGS